MQLFNKTYKYLDKQQNKGTNPATLLLLLYASIVIFFIPLIIKLIQVKQIPRSVVPPEFNMGAILLVASSILLYQSKTFIENDKVWKLKLYLSGALLSGLLFIFLQYEGWKQIYKSSVVSDIKIIMVMVSVHVIHFTGALVMLLTLFIPLFKIKTRADSFIYFLNDKRVAAFNSNRSYWDFLGILWIIIYSIIIWKSM